MVRMFSGVVVWIMCVFSVQAADVMIEASTDEAAKPWTSLEANDAPEDFHFVVVTDRTGGHRDFVFRDALPKVNLLEPAFVVSVGDLIEGYTDDQARLDAEWDEMEGFIGQLETPFFYAAGNHDMSNAVMAETWRKRFGPSYYHFKYKGVLFLVLNSELFGMVGQPDTPVPGPWQQAQQMGYIEQTLKDNADARWTVVITHQPLWDIGEIDPDWLQVESWLDNRDYTVFAGHLHRYKKQVRNDAKYYTLATTGGGSALRGSVYGEFDHVGWVTMTGNGPRLANILLDGLWDENVATEESREMVASIESAISPVAATMEGSKFRRATLSYDVSNPGSAPLTVSPVVASSSNLFVATTGAETTIAPGESQRFDIKVTAKRRNSYAELRPASVTWSLGTRVNNQKLDVDVQTPVLPMKRQAITVAKKAITVDGDLGEWKLPFSVTQQGDLAAPETDAADISFRWGIHQDDEFVYLGMSVTDDSIVASTKLPALAQDAMVVVVDARPEAERNQNKSLGDSLEDGSLSKIALNFLTVEKEQPIPVLAFLDEIRAQMITAVSRTDDGYQAELAIPVSYLNKQSGGEWDVLRVSLYAQDFDEDQKGPERLYWQPNRFGDAPLAGTGEFVR